MKCIYTINDCVFSGQTFKFCIFVAAPTTSYPEMNPAPTSFKCQYLFTIYFEWNGYWVTYSVICLISLLYCYKS